MAVDGSFPSKISKNDSDNAANNPILTQLSDGTAALSTTSGALNVDVQNASLTVTATNLDIRDLTSASDSVEVLQATHDNLNANANLQVGNVDVANGNPVPVSDAGGSLTVDGTVSISGSVTVTATDLDIRDLSHTQDSIKIGDGTDFLAINNDGSINVVASLTNDTLADDSAFTVATSKVYPMGAFANETTPDSVDEGDIGAPRMTLDRKLLTRVVGSSDANRMEIDASGRPTVNVNGTVPVSDAGGSLTVDGSVTVSATDLDIRDLTSVTDSVSVLQATHDNLNANANIQVGDTDVSNGNPVPVSDAGGSITVDGSVTVSATDLDIRDLTLALDSVKISANTSANSITNPIFVQMTDATASTENHTYSEDDVSGNSSVNRDLTVAGGTYILKSIEMSASGGAKFQIQTGPIGSLVSKATVFLNGKEGDSKPITFTPPIEVSSGDIIRIIKTNRQGATQTLYSTVMGNII